MAFVYAARATQGARSYQEDAAAVDSADGGALVAVLADGMGGHAGGAVASELASRSFLHAYSASAGDAQSRLIGALDQANAAIGHTAAERPELAGMGCTLIGAALVPGQLGWVSVGDSPLYLVRRGEIVRLNEDHSLAPEIEKLAAAGMMSWEAARNDPRRHVLRSALTGTEIELVDCPRSPLLLEAGDTVILASDGIHSIAEAEIARIVTAAATPAAAAEALLAAVDAAADPHQDNTTVVVVQVAGEGA